ncbi:MAG: metallophosphoesterase [Nitrospirae bacterium]|nr:metallophosphoesterase [Nitrospirota bacterium]
MSLFLVTFFLIYGSIHAYAFLKAKAALAFGATISVYLIIVMAILFLAPLIVHYSEKYGLEALARVMSYVGYMWLGVLFLFFSCSVAIDAYRLVIYLGGGISQRDLSTITPSVRTAFFLPLIFSLSASIYGYFEAKNIRTERLMIKTSKIPKEVGRLKIVQISDVHIGLIVSGERLKRILGEVKKAEPDILVSTGDLVDGQINRLEGVAELIREITPRYGKFAITGNHEYYAGLSQAVSFTKKAGFSVLGGEGLTVGGIINIAGVDDPAGRYYGLFGDISEKELLSSLPSEKFTLLLKHRPLIDKKASGFFDLQLSGHVHRGQIFPFSIVTRLYYPVHAGFASLPNNSGLYVSRGAGTWGPPIRFLSPPEVTVIELVHED